MDTVLSGIRSTGHLHLGNYFGALRNFVRMQHENRCFFFIADYHSLTTHPDPGSLHANVKDILCEYLAVGIDPEVATIYVQSDVPETVELYLLLNMHAYMGELAKTTSFKEKARKQPENVNAGLLTYPTLMAADILQHNADKVPVGKDQEQHLELTRRFARRFNNLYKVNFFTEPQPYNFDQELVKIPGLDGSRKMGKSEGNCIFLCEDPKLIKKKVMKALTDAGPTEPHSAMPESIENLFVLLKSVSSPDTVAYFEEQWNNCSIRYGDLKKQLAADIIAFTTPIRERYLDICNNDEYLHKVAVNGAEKARASAAATLREVRHIMGIRPF
ncbi:MAG: tryptophan--tRNA ligase [Bacteroidales bacterium]|jgi:tryptophanyl-tRNA synthetase|nr:tryptophan--tRNA ligase [Bacteroidales bacterium]MDI9544938.1 tryptophan--tRNA ligase [Bacteroidota bacterium]MBP8981716.1 tryptophan--tRNA ligase [Bacteroidales bacterium]NLV37778.1 tryptophan--tRNA ligase [Bacteroidales bacterium]HNZ80282.1 tryptophan--tRNA ligase [Bacteroidales bacterium]